VRLAWKASIERGRSEPNWTSLGACYWFVVESALPLSLMVVASKIPSHCLASSACSIDGVSAFRLACGGRWVAATMFPTQNRRNRPEELRSPYITRSCSSEPQLVRDPFMRLMGQAFKHIFTLSGCAGADFVG
jgi:hypothetical protein